MLKWLWSIFGSLCFFAYFVEERVEHGDEDEDDESADSEAAHDSGRQGGEHVVEE